MAATLVYGAVALVLGGCGRIGFDLLGTGMPPDSETPDVRAPLDPSLVALYTCDDDLASGIVADATGHGHDAHCTPGVSCPTTTTGVVGAACLFDGATQYLQVSGDAAFETSSFTVAVFAKRPPTRGQSIVAKPYGPGTTNSWQIEYHFSACLNTDLSFTGAAIASCFSVADIPTDTWFHVAVTYDGATRRAYVNGQERLNAADSTISFDGSAIYLAADNNNSTVVGFYAGPLDDVRIYERALSPAEIALLATP